MSIANEISRLQGAKADLKLGIQANFNVTIPSSKKIDEYADYMVESPPTANGVYIKYKNGLYSAYNNYKGGPAVGVVLITDNMSVLIHPNQGTSVIGSSRNQYESVSTDASTDFNGKTNTDTMIASGRAGSAFTSARNAVYADGSQGYLPGSGEGYTIRSNATNINKALTSIGGTTITIKQQWGTSTQESASFAYRGSDFYDNLRKEGKSTSGRCRSIAPFPS